MRGSRPMTSFFLSPRRVVRQIRILNREVFMQVYIAKDGRQEGPYTVEYINSEVAAGRIKPTDLAWMEGWASWQPVSMVPGFLSAAPPPPPPSGAPPPPPPPPMPTVPGVAATSEQETLLRTFVGKNYEYYSRKWAEAEQKANKNTWNWAAFFLSLWWTAYRKMYRHAAIICGIIVAATIYEFAFGLPGFVELAIDLAIALAYGMQGNRWYKLHAEQKLRELAPTAATDEATRARVTRAGGTSSGAVVACAVLLLVVLGAIGFVGATVQSQRGGGESAERRSVPSPHGQIVEQSVDKDVRIVDGEMDAGYNAHLKVRNQGEPGLIQITVTLSCSEGEWSRTQKLNFDSNEERNLEFFFHEPTMNASNVQARYDVSP
jgi:hypothetical protein